MSKAKNSPRSFRDRARSNAREIALALVLTLGAAGFMIAAFLPAGSPEAAKSNATSANGTQSSAPQR